MGKALTEININGITYAKCCIPQRQFNECRSACDYCAKAVLEMCLGYPNTEAFCGEEDQVCYVEFDKVTDFKRKETKNELV